jgi:ABC-type polysaccharide/polyol phosphate transport system ATPase subunit
MAPADATRAPARPPAVVVDGLSKHFRLPRNRSSTLKERVLHPVQSRQFDVLRAVNEVSFEIGEGEFFGVVGRNGSGKSTLLKCLAGIYDTAIGRATTRGRVSPFIELGVGFNTELTARDNVIINAIMLGLTRREAVERFDDVIDFAELHEFLDMKLKNFSSGMAVRLAFSVAVQVDADILLVDEVLAVGDAAFQQKCFDQFRRLKSAGKTIVFVTHDMGAIERFCDRALLLERGRIMQIGEPHGIARAYHELNFRRLAGDADASLPIDEGVSAQISAAWFEDEAGEQVDSVERAEPVALCVEVTFRDLVVRPRVHFHLRNEVGYTIFATSTDGKLSDTGRYDAGDKAIFRVRMQNWLAPGRYDLTPTLAALDAGPGEALDLRENVGNLIVHGTRQFDGIVDIPHSIDVERGS